ncbi:MAG: alcohol dehydrogenase catalytic domain-containing protein [Bryobacteraceae bacterium]|jgi:2-desacetyl-2-hydroxyethyl bacteriochlorophyllide A dehydrogenase
MRQIVLEAPRLLVGHVVPPVSRQPSQALVRIHRVAICGSDWHAFEGAQANYTFPRIIGHELGCEVLEAPENGRGIRPGDRCAIEPHLTCGVCRPCLLNRPNCCEDMKVLGVHVDGGMRGLMNVPVERLYQSERLSYDQLALVEFLTIGAHAVARSGLVAGEDVLIVGAGPIGLSVLQFALSAGASARIIEKVEFRRQFARRFGVEVLPEYDGRPAFVVFDCTGDEEAITASFDRVSPAGRLVLVGQFLGLIAFDHTPMMRRELNVMMSRNSHHQFPRVIGMIERGEIDVDPWITCRMPLAEVPSVFADLAAHKNYIKAVFEVQDSDV